MSKITLSRKIELLAYALLKPATTKYQAESAGQSLLELAKEVKKLEPSDPEEEEASDPEEEEEAAPVLEVKEAAMEWLKERYSEEELKDVWLEKHDHSRKWLPVRKYKVA